MHKFLMVSFSETMSLSMGMMILETTMKCSTGLGGSGGLLFVARHFVDIQEAEEEGEEGTVEEVEGGTAIRLIWRTSISRFRHKLLT